MLHDNITIVTSYNDMPSIHQLYKHYPEIIRKALHEANAVGQIAGGVLAMCDDVIQGQDGVELSLLNHEVITMSAVVGLSHNVFDGALLLGICSKIVPGLAMAALSLGYLPAVFVPSRPMASGLPNKEKVRIRQPYAEGEVDRVAPLESGAAPYHAPGTCTLYGIANTSRVAVELIGMRLPDSPFIHSDSSLRDALTTVVAHQVTRMAGNGNEWMPIGRVIDERMVVSGIVALLATGGSINHIMHLVAMVRVAGIQINWDDFPDLSGVVPLTARLYPNGPADINHFQTVGGVPVLARELLKAGLLYKDVNTVAGFGLSRYILEPQLNNGEPNWREGAEKLLDSSVIASFEQPLPHHGGTEALGSNLGRTVMKASAASVEDQVIEAPAVVLKSQHDVMLAFEAGLLDRDCVVVVRHQGPKANGAPELHKLMPPLGVLLNRCLKVTLATDRRFSGASDRVPSAIHATPEAYDGGLLAKVHDGDIIRVNGRTGELTLLVDEAELAAREPYIPDPSASRARIGRELSSALREKLSGAEQGATRTTSQDDKFIIRRERTLMKDQRISAELILTTGPVVPVIVVKKLEHVVPMAKALVAGGVCALEVTLCAERAIDAIHAITKGVPEVIMDAGTAPNPQQLAEIAGAGTQFATSPGLTEPLLEAATEETIPLIPGTSTISELMLGVDHDLKEFKFLPTEADGGVKALQAIAGPFSQVRFRPTGGTSPANYRDYLALKGVLCIDGSWLVPADALEAGDYDRITELAHEAVEGVKL